MVLLSTVAAVLSVAGKTPRSLYSRPADSAGLRPGNRAEAM